MFKEHPNLTVLSKLNLGDLEASSSLFSNDFVLHYFNPKLPDIAGDYIGVEGLKTFFTRLTEKTGGHFKVEPISTTPVGNELIVVQTRNTLKLEGHSIAVDVVVIWRIVEGKISEGWDIPSAFTLAM